VAVTSLLIPAGAAIADANPPVTLDADRPAALRITLGNALSFAVWGT